MIRPFILVLGVAAAILLGFPVLWIAVGSVLPRETSLSHSALLPHSPEKVWALLTDFPGQTAWRPRLQRVEKASETAWIEQAQGGLRQRWETVEAESPRKLVRRLAGPSESLQGQWIFQLSPESGGCRLTITRVVRISNPALRLAARLFGSGQDPVLEYLQALERKLNQS